MKRNLQWYLQIALWIIYTVLLILLFNKNFSLSDSILRTAVIISVQAALFYTNSYYLFPKLIESKKVWKYILHLSIIIIILLIFFSWFERSFHSNIINELGNRRMNRMAGEPRPILPRKLLNAQLLFDILSLMIILVLSSAFSAAQISQKRELKDFKSSQAQLESEMKFLKSQINPHFLFNALNNIYSLTLTGSDKSSELILKLSAMLRYILYECNGPYVSIEKEWEYILNFIDFQKIKSKEAINIEMEFTNDAPGSLITPMIFIPFIENAFKHSHVDSIEEAWLNISLNNKTEEIIFQVDNSIPTNKQSKDEVGGVGLENVKRRLELIYSKNYDLIINEKKNSYSVILRIHKRDDLSFEAKNEI